ncbi:MAG: hypothetical protein BIFFINMI_03659 [Phycisphaerae bacterium]|nr:hypothetical protein [Phycisphaerae bacterium]
MPRSFVDFLDRYGAANPPAMVYRDGEDFAAWQRGFADKVRELLGPLPPRVEPAVHVLDTIDAGDHVRHVLEIPVNAFSTLPAYLLVPRGLAAGERRPGLLAFHGHAEFGIDSICGLRGMGKGDNARRACALSAVRAGYVVLAPAWWGWHGRDGHLGLVDGRDKCNVIQMAAGMYGLCVLHLHMQDAAAALDVLAGRPEVQADRIGCLGNSYGGRTAMWFALLDRRVRACVVGGAMNTFRERSLKLSSCGIQYPQGLLAWGDVPELFSLIASRPLQLQAGKADDLLNASDREHIHATVSAAYGRLGAGRNYDYVLHDGGHILVWEPAEAFLRLHL